MQESVTEIVIPTDEVDGSIPVVKRPPNWINSVVKTVGLTFAGDSRGQIFICGQGFTRTLKVSVLLFRTCLFNV